MRGKYVRSLFVTNTQNTCYGYALTLEVASNPGPHTRYKNEVIYVFVWAGGLSYAPYRYF